MITETEALRMGEQALAKIEDVRPPYAVSLRDGTWVVSTGTVFGSCYAALIDGTTGQVSVEFYQSVIIDEDL